MPQNDENEAILLGAEKLSQPTAPLGWTEIMQRQA